MAHIRHTTPALNQIPISHVPALSLGNLAVLNEFSGSSPPGGDVSLTSKDDVTTLPAWLMGETPDPSGKTLTAVPCVVIVVEQTPRQVDAFYFYFYSYDRGPNLTQVVEPLNRLVEDTENGMHFGDHVGDWSVSLMTRHSNVQADELRCLIGSIT